MFYELVIQEIHKNKLGLIGFGLVCELPYFSLPR